MFVRKVETFSNTSITSRFPRVELHIFFIRRLVRFRYFCPILMILKGTPTSIFYSYARCNRVCGKRLSVWHFLENQLLVDTDPSIPSQRIAKKCANNRAVECSVQFEKPETFNTPPFLHCARARRATHRSEPFNFPQRNVRSTFARLLRPTPRTSLNYIIVPGARL